MYGLDYMPSLSPKTCTCTTIKNIRRHRLPASSKPMATPQVSSSTQLNIKTGTTSQRLPQYMACNLKRQDCWGSGLCPGHRRPGLPHHCKWFPHGSQQLHQRLYFTTSTTHPTASPSLTWKPNRSRRFQCMLATYVYTSATSTSSHVPLHKPL